MFLRFSLLQHSHVATFCGTGAVCGGLPWAATPSLINDTLAPSALTVDEPGPVIIPPA